MGMTVGLMVEFFVPAKNGRESGRTIEDYTDAYWVDDRAKQLVKGIRLRQGGPRHFEIVVEGGSALGRQLASGFPVTTTRTEERIAGDLEILRKEFDSQATASNDEILSVCNMSFREKMLAVFGFR